ncbi:MAG: SprB repeat-containing protein [Marinoscillum sp.]
MKFVKINKFTNVLLAAISISICACEPEKVEIPFDCTTSGLDLETSSSNTSCGNADGSVQITATGGAAPYSYHLGTSDDADGLFENLAAGTYQAKVTDANGCTANSPVQVSNTDGVNITNVAATEAGCGSENGSVTITAEGGTAPYSYALSDVGTSGSGDFTGLAPGSYDITVTDDNGCSSTETVELLTGISLENDIMEIINTNCAISGCHANSQSPLFTSKENIIGNSSRILARTSAGTMPPSGKLPDASIALIKCWVEDGAKNN